MSEFTILDKASGTAQPADIETAARMTNIEASAIERLIAERGVCESIDHVVSRPRTPALAQQEFVRLARAEAAAASRTAAEADASNRRPPRTGFGGPSAGVRGRRHGR